MFFPCFFICYWGVYLLFYVCVLKGGCVGIEGELFRRVEKEGQSGQGGNRENALDGVGTRGYCGGEGGGFYSKGN